MKYAQVIEGTPKEIQGLLRTLSDTIRLTLIVPPESEHIEGAKNLVHSTPEDRARALDEIAAMNRDLPALPNEVFSRENLYEECR